MADENNNNDVDSDIIVSAIQFWRKVYEEPEVVIKFTKQDGAERIMRCTLNFKRIPEKNKPKGVNIQQILKLIQQNKIMHVYDLDKKGWRSVPFDRVEYMDTSEKRFYVKKAR